MTNRKISLPASYDILDTEPHGPLHGIPITVKVWKSAKIDETMLIAQRFDIFSSLETIKLTINDRFLGHLCSSKYTT